MSEALMCQALWVQWLHFGDLNRAGLLSIQHDIFNQFTMTIWQFQYLYNMHWCLLNQRNDKCHIITVHARIHLKYDWLKRHTHQWICRVTGPTRASSHSSASMQITNNILLHSSLWFCATSGLSFRHMRSSQLVKWNQGHIFSAGMATMLWQQEDSLWETLYIFINKLVMNPQSHTNMCICDMWYVIFMPYKHPVCGTVSLGKQMRLNAVNQ